jgi:hypothetical protein
MDSVLEIERPVEDFVKPPAAPKLRPRLKPRPVHRSTAKKLVRIEIRNLIQAGGIAALVKMNHPNVVFPGDLEWIVSVELAATAQVRAGLTHSRTATA